MVGMETNIPVKEVMVRDVVKADMRMNARDAARMMLKYDVDSVIIVNRGEPIGIVTERDMIRELVSKDIKPSTVGLKDLMKSPLVTASPDDDLMEVARMMLKNKIRRVPVVENGKLVGIVADVDILAVYSEMNSILAELVEMNVEREIGQSGEELSQGICERCGTFSENLSLVDGLLLCESCREG